MNDTMTASRHGQHVPNDKELYEVTMADLPLHCPLPTAPLWARHPRVFLDVY